MERFTRQQNRRKDWVMLSGLGVSISTLQGNNLKEFLRWMLFKKLNKGLIVAWSVCWKK